MVLLLFFFLDRKYPFWANLVQKIRIVGLSWHFVPRINRICRIQWRCLLFLLKYPFWANLVHKLKIISLTEFGGEVYFLCFRAEVSFFGKFVPKDQNCQFKLRFGTMTSTNMQNSMVMFTFFILDQKYPFWAKLVQKFKTVSLSWNLVPSLILMCII